MAFDEKGNWKPESDSTAEKVAQITSSGSPLMTKAAGMGMSLANKRGLLNSSMAAKSSQNAVLDAAVPIASQDAAQTAQKNLQFMTGKTQLDLQDKQIEGERGLQDMRGSQALAQIGAQSAGERELQQLRGDQQMSLETAAGQRERELQELRGGQSMQLQTLQGQQSLEQISRQAQAGDRERIAAAFTQMTGSYNDAVAAVSANKDLDATARSNYLTSLRNSTLASIGLLEQLYDVDLDWGGEPAAPPTTPGLGGGIFV